MPLRERTRLCTSSKPALDLPPPFRLVTLREVGDAFAHATRVATEEGAGTLVYVGRFDLAEFAVVLEPEEPLKTARRAVYAGLTALADALAVHAPPERPITFDWPDGVRVNGGLVGGARLAWPQGGANAQARALHRCQSSLPTSLVRAQPGAQHHCQRRRRSDCQNPPCN